MMAALEAFDLQVGPVTLTLARSGHPAWPNPAHRLIEARVRGKLLVRGVAGYLSDYRVADGPWAWAGKAHGGEVQDDEPVVSPYDPYEQRVETRATLSVPDSSGAYVPVVHRTTVHRLRALSSHAVEYARTDVLLALADHGQRIEYIDMIPLLRMYDGDRAWLGWATDDARGDVAKTWTGSSVRLDLGPSSSILLAGPYAGLLRDGSWPRTRVIDRTPDVKLYAVGLDAQALGDSVRSVVAGSSRVYESRWTFLV